MSNDIAALAALMVSGDQQRFRLRQGEITAVASNNTCTVTIAGDTDNPISEVNYASTVCPVPGAGCWIATDGEDLFVVATIAPYGPAVGNMRRTTNQVIADSTWVAANYSTSVNRADEYNYGTINSETGIQVLVPGLWAIMATPMIVQNSGGSGRAAAITVNGTRVWSGSLAPSSGTMDARMVCSATLKLAIGDVVGIDLFQNSGGGRNTAPGVGQGLLNVRWIGTTPV
jgi:hypothetical protein